MKSPYEIIRHNFKNRDDIVIYPVADVHLGSPECRVDDFWKFIGKVEKDPNARLVLVGDLINNATRSSVSNIFEETMRPSEQKRMMAEMLKPVADKILCMVSGNHERRSVRDGDDDPSYDIAAKLDIEDLYRPELAVVHIQMGETNGFSQSNPAYMLAVTHGAGGGNTTGASVNRSEKFAGVIEGIDLMVTGHTHKPSVTPPLRLVADPRTGKVYTRATRVVVCSSWLNYGGYAMEKMLTPTGFVKQRILLTGKKKKIEVIM